MTANLVCVYWKGFTIARALHIKLRVTPSQRRKLLRENVLFVRGNFGSDTFAITSRDF